MNHTKEFKFRIWNEKEKNKIMSYKDFKNLKFRKFTVGAFPLHISWNNMVEFLDNPTFDFDIDLSTLISNGEVENEKTKYRKRIYMLVGKKK